MRTAARWCRWIPLACLVAASVHAQEEKPASVVTETVTVDIVNLDVVVTDRRGEPITGLSRKDFELLVDREPTPIENFYIVEPDAESAAAESKPPEADGPRPPTETLEEVAVPRDQQLHLVILVDNRHATPGERKRALEQLAAAFDEGLGGPGRRAAVLVYDGGVEVRQPFTRDGAEIAAALSELRTVATGYTADFERRNILRQMEQIRLGDDTGPAAANDVLASIEFYVQQRAGDLRNTLGAIQNLVDGLSGLPGRKALLYIASGLSTSPGRELLAAWQSRFGNVDSVNPSSGLTLATGQYDAGSELRELARRANASRVAFYAIGTAGAGPGLAISAERGGFDPSALDTAGGGRTWDATIDAAFQASQGSGMELMAAVTGGDALTGSGNYELMAERIERDASHTYSLGFRSPRSKPGTSHRVEVRVRKRDVRVHHRREFVTESPREQAADRTLAALLWDAADNSLGVAVDFGPPQPSERGDGKAFVQPILVKVPFVNLVLLPEDRHHRGQVTIFVAAEDGQGRISPVQTIEAPIEIPTNRMAEALRGVAGYRVGLLMRPGPNTVAVGVRDEIGNVVSTVRIEHEARPPGGS